MILTIATGEINHILKSSGRRKVDLEIAELDEDKAIIVVKKGIKQHLTLTDFRLEDGKWIYAKVKPALLMKVISSLPIFGGRENLVLKDGIIGFKLPQRVISAVKVQSIKICCGAVVIEGQLAVPPA